MYAHDNKSQFGKPFRVEFVDKSFDNINIDYPESKEIDEVNKTETKNKTFNTRVYSNKFSVPITATKSDLKESTNIEIKVYYSVCSTKDDVCVADVEKIKIN